MGKRGNNAGTVYESPEGSGRWYAQLPAGPDGRRPRRYAGDGATKEAAEQLLRQLHNERAAGRDLSRKAETVADLLDFALETARPQISPASARAYAAKAAHITDRIGAMKITAVTWEIVQRLANDLIAADLSAGYVRGILSHLSAAYGLVVPEKVTSNPVNWRRLKLKKARPAERQPAEDRTVARLLAAGDDLEARGADVRYGPAWWLMGLLGLRRAEVCALLWSDVDWERAELKVRRTYTTDEDGHTVVKPATKTGGTRTIPIGPRLLVRLKQHWAAQQAERRHQGAQWKEHGAIIADETGARLGTAGDLNYRLRQICTAARLPHTTPHQLRHTVATLIDEAGYSEVIAASILGHDKGESMTARYTHAREQARRAAVIAVETAILGAAADAAKEAR